jgi:NTF2 fold immunity protein
MSEQSESPESHLRKFMSAMSSWETELIDLHRSSGGTYLNSASNEDATRNALIRIYETFLTKKKRKTGRVAALDFGTPLAFNLELEKLVQTTLDEAGKKAVIETVYTTYAALKRRYTLVLTKDGWRIDRREDFSTYKDKWVSVTL